MAVVADGGGGSPFRALLAAKIAEIREVATRRYVMEPDNEVMFDANGAVMVNPRGTVGTSGEGVQEFEQGVMDSYQGFRELVDELAARFETYYELDPPYPIASLVSTLDVEQPLGVDWSDESLNFDKVIEQELPEAPRTAYDRLHAAYVNWVSPVEEMITTELWDGDGAAAFLSDVIVPFRDAKALHMGCTKAVAITAQALHDGVAKTQADLISIADECIAMLEFGGDAGTAQKLAVASLFAGAVGLLLSNPVTTAAGAAAYAAGGASIGLGTASTFVDLAGEEQEWSWSIKDGAEKAPGGGYLGLWSSAYATVWSTLEVLDTLADCLAAQNSRIAFALLRFMESPDTFGNPKIKLERPGLADGPEELGKRPYRPGDGKLERDLVVANIRDVYEAGYQNLPGAAEQYEQAASLVAGGDLPSWLRRFFPTTVWNYDEARAILAGYLRRTRDILAESGESLVQAAKGYEFTDGERALALAEFEKVLSWEEAAADEFGW